MSEKSEKKQKLAEEILRLSRNTLLVNLRFLDMALSQFQYVPTEKSTLLTDGQRIFYNPSHILQSYKLEREIPTRDYLHIVLHCVFRHMYTPPTVNRPYWDLACDIAVENIISDLGIQAVTSSRASAQEKQLNLLRQKIKKLTAEKVYYYLMDQKTPPKEAAELRGAFYADNHEIWYMSGEEIRVALGLQQEAPAPSSGNGSGNGESGGANTQQEALLSRSQMEQVWKDISDRMQVDLETFSQMQGHKAGSLTQNLKSVNREKYDYTEFLRKFSVMGETLKINDDEFDYIFYTYGLQLYDRMPLIEPLEYKEVKRIKEFVIAIDTSGSTSGELVQNFLQKTFNILKSEETFFSKINLHIIQCDAEIQEDVKITCQKDFDEYLKTMKIRGLGGTDFRPVFSYVEKLRKEKEFTNLKGLIYFTDGFGTFPKNKPDYDTAFVYVNDEDEVPEVPSWAIRLVLPKEDLK